MSLYLKIQGWFIITSLYVVLLYLAFFAEPILGSTIAWPTILESATAVGAQNLLGPPNGDTVAFQDGSNARYSGFNDIVFYDTGILASAMGISEPLLATSDFMAFDGNGVLNFGFETSTWEFNDGGRSVIINHVSGGGANGALIVNSSMSVTDFNTIFGTSIGGSGNIIGYLLFDLSSAGINASSSTFFAEITGGLGDPRIHAPDVLGLGVHVVPLPSALYLFATSLIFFVGLKKKFQR